MRTELYHGLTAAEAATYRSGLAKILGDSTGGGGVATLKQLASIGKIRTPYYFDGVGDGVADDTVALQAWLNDAFGSNGNGFAYLPYGMWRTTDTLSYTFGASAHRYRNFGVISDGGVIKSAIANTSKNGIDLVVQTSGGAQVRSLHIVGLTMEGQGGASPVEQDGINILCDQSGQALYAFYIDRLSLESFGRHNLKMTGNVFEGGIYGSKFRGAGTDGINFANGSTGIVSSIDVVLCNIAENRGAGVNAGSVISDIAYGYSHFISNGSYGVSQVNGGFWNNCHFENNHNLAGSFVDGQGAIACNNFAGIFNCRALNNTGKQANLLRTSVVNNQKIVGGITNTVGGTATSTVWLNGGGTAGRSIFIEAHTLIGTGTTYSAITPICNFVVDGQPRPFAVTTGRTLTPQESGAIITNSGAGGSTTYTLPTTANTRPGMAYEFIVLTAQNMVVTANTGATIQIAGSASTSGGTATNGTIGSVLRIRAVSTTLWVAEHVVGTWTLA